MVLGKIIPSYQKNYLPLYIAEDSLHANIIVTNHSAKTWQVNKSKRYRLKLFRFQQSTLYSSFLIRRYYIMCLFFLFGKNSQFIYISHLFHKLSQVLIQAKAYIIEHKKFITNTHSLHSFHKSLKTSYFYSFPPPSTDQNIFSPYLPTTSKLKGTYL